MTRSRISGGEYAKQNKRAPGNLSRTALDQLINDMLVMQKARKDGWWSASWRWRNG
jgi:hypothetical protein